MNLEFLKTADDIIVVSTHNRPDLMVNQVLSFVDNMELFIDGYRSKSDICSSNMPEEYYVPRNVQFIFVDDSDVSYEKSYKEELERLKKLIENHKVKNHFNVDYIKKIEQIDLIKSFGTKANLEKTKYEQFFSDINGRKTFGGIRGICNIGRLLGLYYAKHSNKSVNLHFLDSDVFPFVMINDGKNLTITNSYYFLGHKSHILSNSKIRAVGTYFDIDSPSPIIDLYEALWFLEMYFNKFTQVDIDSPKDWQSFTKQFIWIGENLKYELIDKDVISLNDRNLIDEPVITSKGTFKTNLLKVSKLLNILMEGNNRFVFNTANYSKTSNWHGERDYFGNGCTSMRFEEAKQFRPYPLFGNQELILFPYEYATRGGVFWGDLDVSHIKEPRGRLSLLDDLEMTKEGTYRQKHDFRQLFEIISYFEAEGLKISKGIDIPRRRIKDDALKFSVYGENTVDKIVDLVNKIEEYCKKINSSDNPNILEIESSVNKIHESIPKIKNQYNFKSRENITSENKSLVDQWINSFNDWDILINEVIK